eukprot:TRINITY_DN43753_c0_g1_i1.p1 TRINITY_DN43753_c0_g1~~TRINITY_DN43753_c0_g1_i1.p1  ORF type:complete len:461 (+),score=78.33 TRINITY_DN43753_c0_g1_i1:44-1384(+)
MASLDAAVALAKEGFMKWSCLSGVERGRKLMKVADMIRDMKEELAVMEVRETNIAIREVREDHVEAAAGCFEFFGGLAGTALNGTMMDLPHAGAGPHSFGYTRREPLGICAGISAWNYPLMLSAWKAAPAMCAGNAIIIKPSELTPSTTKALESIILSAGIPKGVFQTIEGDGTVGAQLCKHPSIAKISFTGSVPTGRKVASLCGEHLKPTTMELGGKSPLIIFADADITAAVESFILANFCNSGQACSNGTRVYVQEEFLDTFLENAIPKVESIRLGDPMGEATQMGPLINKTQFEKVTNYITTAQNDPSCKILTGGAGEGLFVKPTVILCSSDEAEVVKDEVFGPVATILTFKTEEEAVTRANNTPFGLAGGIITKDISRAHRVAKLLQAGTTFINTYNICPAELPFGAYKQSGYGRENSPLALLNYTQVKSVFVEEGVAASGF